MKPTHALIADYLDATGPRPASAIAAHFGKSRAAIEEHLRLCRERGYAKVTAGGGIFCLWYTPRHADAARAEMARLNAEAQAARKLKNLVYDRKRKARLKRERDEARAGRNTAELPVIRAIVPADSAPRVRCAAPRSVFDLAAYV
jgi:DNA-binding transcriptional ArsR family regulator